MNLNINLFVHGVPMGQKIWGPRGDDQIYISSFYGPKWDAPEVMKIDIMTFGGVFYCYYSFVKGQNVFDSQGRAGSYFALTLRVNAFYADVQNFYHILKAAYDKICVGLCVQETNGSAKFMLADFQSIDKELKGLEKRILDYIGEFSIGNDLIDLSGYTSNSQNGVLSFNLHECTNEVASNAIKQCGKLMVSPWYLSENAAKTVAHYKEEMEATVQKAKKEIELQKQTSQKVINEINQQAEVKIASVKREVEEELTKTKEQSRQQLSQLKEDYDQRIIEIKNSYADIDKEIKSLNDTIREKEREVSDLKLMCRKKDKELQSSDVKIRKLKQQVDPIDNIDGQPDGNKPSWVIRYKQWIFLGLASFFTLLLAGLVIWLVIQDLKGKQSPVPSAKEQIEIENKQITNDSVTKVPITINIKELENKNDSVLVGKIYTLSIDGEETDTLNVIWKSEEFVINGNTIMAKRDFAGEKGKISIFVDNKELASKEIYIKSDK